LRKRKIEETENLGKKENGGTVKSSQSLEIYFSCTFLFVKEDFWVIILLKMGDVCIKLQKQVQYLL